MDVFAANTPILRAKETYTTLKNFGYANLGNNSDGKVAKYEYNVAGKLYTYTGGFIYGSQIGEKYKILYDSLFPYTCQIQFDKPLFLPGERTKKTIGEIVNIDIYQCNYKYSFELPGDILQALNEKPNNTREQWTGFAKNFELSRPYLKAGSKFIVEYSADNFLRAIIYLDRPASSAEILNPAIYRFNPSDYSSSDITVIDSSALLKDKILIKSEIRFISSQNLPEGPAFTYGAVDKHLEFTIDSFTGTCKQLEQFSSDIYTTGNITLIANDVLKTEISGLEARYRKGDPFIQIKYGNNIKQGNTLINFDLAYVYLHSNRIIYINNKQSFGLTLDYKQQISDQNENQLAAYDYCISAKQKYDSSDFSGAISDYDKAISLDPNLVDAYNNRGTVKAMYKDFAGAILDFSKAIELKPDNAEAYLNRGATLIEKKDYKNALNDLNKALELNPHNVLARFNRGIASSVLGDYPAAILDYDEVLVDNPDDEEAYYNRANAKLATHDYKGAIEDCNRAIAINSQSETGYVIRGDSKYALGDKSGAYADWKIASSMGDSYSMNRLKKRCK